jgi:cytoskeletal protein RodZ
MKDESAKSKTRSFGRYLQTIRQNKGIRLATVARDTRIRVDILEKIEAEDHAQLPDEVFVAGFIKAYAEAIGANPDEAVKRYRSRLQVINRLAQSEADLNNISKTYWRRLSLAFGVLFGLIVFSVYMYTHFRLPQEPSNSKAPALQQTPAQQLPAQAESNLTPTVLPESAAGRLMGQKYVLKIKAVEETWMKVVIDGREPSEYSLNPGDYLELEAIDNYDLLVGNNGGVELTLNERPVDIPGKRGQVANIILP